MSFCLQNLLHHWDVLIRRPLALSISDLQVNDFGIQQWIDSDFLL